ncbi:MAG: hypothetical protein WCD89_13370 [Anaerocolumna sp.]
MKAEEKKISRSASIHMITDFKNITLEELEHIASCDFCAEQYANHVEQQDMIKAPHYLKACIIQKSMAFSEIQETKEHYIIQLPWKKLQLLRYSMKIGLAMCGAIAILLLSPTGNVPRTEPSGMVNFFDKVNSDLREFSNNMVEYTEHLVSDSSNKKEDIVNDKKKE